MEEERVRKLNDRPENEGGNCVIYWMQHTQRAVDNLALDFAVSRANELRKPLVVYFGIDPNYPLANLRSFHFMIHGLAETGKTLEESGIPFILREGVPSEEVVKLAKELNPCLVVVDKDYVRIGRQWRDYASRNLEVTLYQIDADVVVPTDVIQGEQYGAYVIRPKIAKVLNKYLYKHGIQDIKDGWKDGPDIERLDYSKPDDIIDKLDIDRSVRVTKRYPPGTAKATERLHYFIKYVLDEYKDKRDYPHLMKTSQLSPYLHFGQISPITVAVEVDTADVPSESKDAYLEQMIVRRELAINFCVYNDNYDRMEGMPEWARKTLKEHENDPRPEMFSLEELALGKTYDDLWNAAQIELIKTGSIHNYPRMYWGKKLLEWTETPEKALETAIYLNDWYALDGRDPDGYAGIAWSIAAKHDRPWFERPIYGKIRYQAYESRLQKIDLEDYRRVIDEMGNTEEMVDG